MDSSFDKYTDYSSTKRSQIILTALLNNQQCSPQCRSAVQELSLPYMYAQCPELKRFNNKAINLQKFIDACKKGTGIVFFATSVTDSSPCFISTLVFELDCLKVKNQFCAVQNTIALIKAGAKSNEDIPDIFAKGSFKLMWYVGHFNNVHKNCFNY
jgi:hypothetical protein